MYINLLNLLLLKGVFLVILMVIQDEFQNINYT